MSDFTRHGKSVGIFVLLISSVQVLFAQSEAHRSDAWVTDNNVSRVEHSNGYTLLSGGFSSLGKYSGGAIYTDVATGKDIDESLPKINGQATDVVSDGTGGWYIGGYFDMVDTVSVSNLVHIRSDKTVDRSWKPNPDNAPSVLKLNGTTLYVGGYFNQIAGQLRNNLVSFNTTTGALSAWTPNPNSSVEDIEISGTTLIVGGSFTLMGATVRTRLAAFDIATGSLTTWSPNINARVARLALDGTGVFIAGDFTSAGGASRTGVARIDLTSTLATAPVITLNSGAFVNDLQVAGGILYLAGSFTTVNGATRNNIASLNVATAAVSTLNLNLTSTDYVGRISIDGTSLYLVGTFNVVNGTARQNAAAINSSTGALLNWDPSLQNAPNIVVATSSGIWLGGYFSTVDNNFRNGFVLIEEATNTLWPFQIDIGGYVNTIAVKDNIVYIGGQFNSVNKTSRSNLAALDLRTGTLLSWDPKVYGLSVTDRTAVVNSIKIKDNQLFVAGRFYAVNSMATIRPGLASVDLATGAATSWNPLVGDGKTINQYVNSIDILGTTLYAGGVFNLLNLSVTRNNVAAISTENANILTWDPNASGEVFRVRANTSTVYVTGSFQGGIGGTPRPYGIAALDAATGKPTTWNPTLDGVAYDIALQNTSLFVAGYFGSIDTKFRPGLASFNTQSGTLNDWTPDIEDDGEGGYSTNTLSVSTSRLFVGGNFQRVGGEQRPYYAEYDLCPGKPDIVLNGTTLSTNASGDLQWYAYGEAVPGATSSSFEVSPIEYGVYAVSVTEFGCEIFSDDAIYSVTALENEHEPSINIYPNPAEVQITVEGPALSQTLDITLTDIMGRVLRAERNTTARTLSFSEYGPGTYVLIVESAGTRYVRKVMKVR
ncbi:T9SS type A sorting domain-containing protein [Chryseolinea sp. T2]|uniref:T9SS type A sorting domain-containing protein n=1 Tax=Chryseolinea sp. T2 TaxID=3129255 RepID=UPI0030779368